MGLPYQIVQPEKYLTVLSHFLGFSHLEMWWSCSPRLNIMALRQQILFIWTLIKDLNGRLQTSQLGWEIIGAGLYAINHESILQVPTHTRTHKTKSNKRNFSYLHKVCLSKGVGNKVKGKHREWRKKCFKSHILTYS